MIYEYRDQVLQPGQPISVIFKSPIGPWVIITVDPDMHQALQAMNYGSLQAVNDDFAIRRHHWPCEFEAFVSQLNYKLMKKILAELNHCQPSEIAVKTLPACTGKPDFRELARMLASDPEYLAQEGW
ncbi:MAG: hypothetical protein NTX82_01545 [Candidatus Parcubacteria bacterium]|nr:hypothetical protein [Candidatus Parcubacteria bacterium]